MIRVVFAGTPDFSARHLEALLKAANIEVVGVYTQPDRQSGRGKKITQSPVKEVALAHDIPVFQPVNFKNAVDVEQLAQLNCDVMVVVAYGLLLPQSVLDAPKYGCINVHASLLPRWRGAAPIQRAIEAGDTETGVTIMKMELGLDTGPMISKQSIPITNDTTGGSLHDELIELGCPALIDVLTQFEGRDFEGEAQDDGLATYAHKLSKADGCINWNESAQVIQQKIRAFYPFPIAWTQVGDEVIRIHRSEVINLSHRLQPGTIIRPSKNDVVVACGENQLRLDTVQLPSKRAMAIKDVLNGRSELFSEGVELG